MQRLQVHQQITLGKPVSEYVYQQVTLHPRRNHSARWYVKNHGTNTHRRGQALIPSRFSNAIHIGLGPLGNTQHVTLALIGLATGENDICIAVATA